MGRKRKTTRNLLRCSDCGEEWVEPERKKFFASHCPFCEANSARLLLRLLKQNYAFPRQMRFCTRCNSVVNGIGCENCGNPEFSLHRFDIFLQDCWYDPVPIMQETDGDCGG